VRAKVEGWFGRILQLGIFNKKGLLNKLWVMKSLKEVQPQEQFAFQRLLLNSECLTP